MKKDSVISIAQNLLMILLFALMLVQCVVYISLVQSYEDGGLTPFPESEAELLASGDTARGNSARSYISPYFVGAISNGERYGGAYDDSTAHEVFGLFTEVLESAPNGTAKKVYFSETDKKYEYLDKLYETADNCYYVKMKNGFGFSVLCQLMSDTYTNLPENPDFEICEMFLTAGSLGEAEMTAVDSEGNVLKIYPSKNIPFNDEYLKEFIGAEKDEFEFVKVDVNIKNNKNCYFPSFKYTMTYNGITKKVFSECFDISAESNDLRSFVTFFGMNDDNTKFYRRSSDGAMICVEDATSLEITKDGGFEFYPGDDGRDLWDLIDKTDSSNYGFYEYSRAAEFVVGSVNRSFSQYCGILALEDIMYKNGECHFYYDYTVNGIPVEKSGGHALELRFAADKLTYAGGNIMLAELSAESDTGIPQKTAYVLMESNDMTVTYFGPEYCFADKSDAPLSANTRWSVKTENSKAGGVQ